MAKMTLQVRVVTPDGIWYEGPARAVSSFNDMGRFDVLPLHTNFISIVRDRLTLHLAKKKRRKITMKHGILSCVNNKVDIFMGEELQSH